MEYDNTQQEPISYEKPKKKRRWPLVVLVLVLVLGLSAVLHFLNFPAITVEKSDHGFTMTVGKPTQVLEDLPPQPPIENFHGTGRTVEIAPSLPGIERIPAEGAMSLQRIYETVIPSVVTIATQTYGGNSIGTGIIMSHDGYIITNQHVIENAATIQVQLQDDTTYNAAVVGGDVASDLAVLKIDAADLLPAQFGDSSSLRVGDQVVAIGNPIGTGLRGTMTDGIISGISRDLSINGRTMSLLQTNAALNSGNSGGPLINCYGQVVGINTAKLMNSYRHSGIEGLGFAIPMATVKPIVDELIENGYVSGRPAIGVVVEELPLRARIYFGLPEGAHVNSVDPDSDAAQKGLRAGDIITALNGVSISGPSGLKTQKDRYVAGDTVTLTIYRDGAYLDLDIVLMDQVADQ